MERVDRLTNHTPRSSIATVPLAVSIRSQNLRRTPGLPRMRGGIPLGKKSKRDNDPTGHVSVDGSHHVIEPMGDPGDKRVQEMDVFTC